VTVPHDRLEKKSISGEGAWGVKRRKGPIHGGGEQEMIRKKDKRKIGRERGKVN